MLVVVEDERLEAALPVVDELAADPRVAAQELIEQLAGLRYSGRVPVGQYADKNPQADRNNCECLSSSPSDGDGDRARRVCAAREVEPDGRLGLGERHRPSLARAGRIKSSPFSTTRW